MLSLGSTPSSSVRKTRFSATVVLSALAMVLAAGCANGSSDGGDANGSTPSQDGGVDADGGSAGDANAQPDGDANGTPDCLATETVCGDECAILETDPNHCGGCGRQCGSAADCINGQCECGAGTADCNGDIGSTDGTDGCECVGTCNGDQCVVQNCSPDEAFSCSSDDDTVCSAGACETCQAGTTNCDGLGSNGCECTLPCLSGICPGCSYNEPGVCNQDQWCANGTCTACDVGKKNCDTQGTCECGGDCNGAQCGAMSCTYDEPDACKGDDTLWCSSVAGNTCTSCSPGYFNCNNTAGCECDDAGCNGQDCAGSCTGGEC